MPGRLLSGLLAYLYLCLDGGKGAGARKMASRRHSCHILLQRLTANASPFRSLCPAGSGEGHEGLVPSLPGRGLGRCIFFSVLVWVGRYALLSSFYTSSCLPSSYQHGPVWRSSSGTISTSSPWWPSAPAQQSHPLSSCFILSIEMLLCFYAAYLPPGQRVCAVPSLFRVEGLMRWVQLWLNNGFMRCI